MTDSTAMTIALLTKLKLKTFNLSKITFTTPDSITLDANGIHRRVSMDLDMGTSMGVKRQNRPTKDSPEEEKQQTADKDLEMLAQRKLASFWCNIPCNMSS